MQVLNQNSQLKKEKRRREIALCALKVFCEKGYDNTSIDDIVKKVGCSHGLLYHYFKNKKDIFDEIINIKHNQNNDELKRKMDEEKSYTKKLRLFIEDLFFRLVNDENFVYHFYFFVSQSFNYKEKGVVPKKKSCNKKPMLKVMEELFLAGQKNGEFNNKYSPFDCAKLVFSIIQGATINYVIFPKEIQEKISLPNVDFIIEIFTQGVKNEK